MRQAIKHGAWIVLPAGHQPDAALYLQGLRLLQVKKPFIWLYLVKNFQYQTPKTLDQILAASNYVRLFEGFYFPMLKAEVHKTHLIRSFFECMGGQYEESITNSLNVACYDFLLELAEHLIKKRRPEVLDFGCGAGTVLDSTVPAMVSRLIGFDFSLAMASAARSRGLSVLTPGEFERMGPASTDIVMCTYVMHYGISKKQLAHLLSVIRPGGTLVGNLHKGFGSEVLMHWSRTLSADSYEVRWHESLFGPCMSVRKLLC